MLENRQITHIEFKKLPKLYKMALYNYLHYQQLH